jgi:hypothetical protein
LAHDILARLRDSLLLRASVATVAGIVLLGVASGALPLTCFTGLAACQAGSVADAASGPADPRPTIAPGGESGAGARVTTVAEIAPPTLTRNDVVGATFAMLEIDLSPPPEEGELRTRKVRTVAIGPDGTPEGFAAPAPLAASPAASSDTTQVATAAAAEPAAPEPQGGVVASGTPSAAARQHATAVATELAVKPPAAAADTGKAVVKGSGANIRSSPSKSKSKVLFSLAGGERVSVGADEHGWLKITDDQGRSGWVWEELLTRD